MRFSETVKHTAPDLVISQRHDAWLAENNHPRYSREALRFAVDQLARRDRRRMHTVSASSLGECKRYQQFVYIGVPKLPMDAKNAMKVQNGMMVHLRWQMAGLTEGWLSQAEVGVDTHRDRYPLVGTMDGVNWDGSILEIKSINARGFSQVQTFGPLFPHLFQMATYMMASGRYRGSFIYECKDNQEYKEIVVKADDLPMDEVRATAKEVWQHIRNEELFEPLDKCVDREGWVYQSCPFRDRCLKIQNWGEVAHARTG